MSVYFKDNGGLVPVSGGININPLDFKSGVIEAVENVKQIGSSRWIKIGKLCVVTIQDLIFNNSTVYDGGYANHPILISGLPKPKYGYGVFTIRVGDYESSYYVSRLVVTKNGDEGVIKPHYSSITGNSNYYGIFAYECES